MEAALNRVKHKLVGPPPPTVAMAGRMNAAGIPVFYGAMSEDTAVAEVRPSVGGLVVLAGFRPTRKLRLLDLTRIGEGFTGSIFSPSYENDSARLRFLEGFHERIARPVQPEDELIEYIPTQAVAEYVANVLGFDGVVYASAQSGSLGEPPREHQNVALFNDASRVSRGDSAERDTTGAGDAAMAPVPSAPSLQYVGGTARVVQVSSVRYEHGHVFVDGEL